ncbi:Na+/H+ antiporter [Pseudonocardia bannensis]
MPTQVFLVAVVLAVAVLLGRLLTGRLGVPDAAAYVVIGVAAGFIPGLPQLRLSPDLVLLLFLPPLIYYAAFFSDPRETLDHLVPVIGQSVGLVLATAMAVAGTLLAIFPDIGWAAAIAFGAAIAPPDPVAATTVLQRLGAPRRLVTVLEGEGLVNDGVALTLFAVAVQSVGASLSPVDVGLLVVLQVGGGIGIGLVVGVVIAWLRKQIRDTPSQVVLSLATPYLAFVPAHLVHASGVLATVTAAAWLGTRGRGVVAPTSRLQTETFWRALNVLLVALLFVLLGLQVPGIVAVVNDYPLGTLVLAAAAVVIVAVVVRLGWVLLVLPLVARLLRDDVTADMSWRERAVLGWCGPRGAVSLAVALSIPLTTASGAPFPRRDLLLFLTVVVVLATLVGQVVPLPAVLRLLRLCPGERERTEGLRARRAAVDAALRELDGIAARDERDPTGAEALRQVLELRRDRLRSQLDVESGTATDVQPDERSLRLQLLEAERRTLRRLYDQGEISGRTMVEVSQELDLDEARLRGAE